MKSLLLKIGRLAAASFVCAVARAAAGGGDPVLEWNEALTQYSASVPRSLECHLEARAYAMTHVAIEEAAAHAQRLGGVVGDTTMERAAVASAGQAVAQACLPGGAARFQALAQAQLARLPEGEARQRGLVLGREAAELVLHKRERDRWAELTADSVPRRLGDAAAFNAAVRDGAPPSPYRDLKPFVLRKSSQIGAPPLHWVTIEGEIEKVPGLSRARIFDDVDRGPLDELTQRWAEAPVVKWNLIARALSENAGHDLRTRARLFAVLNLALADASLATLHWQFTYGSWRREFRQAWVIGGEASYDPQSASPVPYGARPIMLAPVPNFPSLPAALAGAAQAALAQAVNADHVSITVPSPAQARGGKLPAARQFRDIVAAARECSFAATLDASHSREACVSGYLMGVRVGEYVAKRAAAGR